MTQAEKIDAIIKEKGLSRRKVAIMANIPPSTFQSAIERNRNLSLDMLQKIATALNVSLSDLLWNGDGLVPDNVLMAVQTSKGVYAIDMDRHDAYSLRYSISDGYKFIMENLDIANIDDLWKISDYTDECVNIINKRKSTTNGNAPKETPPEEPEAEKEKAPDSDPKP